MTETSSVQDSSHTELKLSVQEAAEKIKKFSEDLRLRLQSLQLQTEDKALGLLQTVENVSDKLHIKTEAESTAFELLESVDALNEKLQSYAVDFENKLSESQLQFHLGLMETMEKWDSIKAKASQALGAAHLDTASPQKLFDEVKLKANLGAMETREFIDKGKEEWNKAWSQVSHQSTVAMKQMSASIGDIIHRFV